MTAAEARALCPRFTLGADEVADYDPRTDRVFAEWREEVQHLGPPGVMITSIAYQRLLEHARDHAFCPWREPEQRDSLWIRYVREVAH